MEEELSEALMSNLQGVLIINVVLLIALFVIMKYVLLNKVEQLVQTSKEVAKGNFDVQIDNPGKDELGVLSSNFNSMIINIRNSCMGCPVFFHFVYSLCLSNAIIDA